MIYYGIVQVLKGMFATDGITSKQVMWQSLIMQNISKDTYLSDLKVIKLHFQDSKHILGLQ